jgi:hypothetical protein
MDMDVGRFFLREIAISNLLDQPTGETTCSPPVPPSPPRT